MNSKIILKGLIDEDFVNYKVPSMTMIFPYCNFKCGKEVCQNSHLINEKNIESDIDELCKRYINNPITESIVCQGLEPFDSFDELIEFINVLRNKYFNDDDIVIYTGYDNIDIKDQITKLSKFKNIIVKFGKFIPDKEHHYDNVLGVELASPNQYAEKVS